MSSVSDVGASSQELPKPEEVTRRETQDHRRLRLWHVDERCSKSCETVDAGGDEGGGEGV